MNFKYNINTMQYKGKKWTDEEENKLVELLKNNKTLEECSKIHQRNVGGIKLRLEYIIYKIIIDEDNQNITDIDLLKQYVDMGIEEIIKKYKDRNKNKADDKILNELKALNNNVNDLNNTIKELKDIIVNKIDTIK